MDCNLLHGGANYASVCLLACCVCLFWGRPFILLFFFFFLKKSLSSLYVQSIQHRLICLRLAMDMAIGRRMDGLCRESMARHGLGGWMGTRNGRFVFGWLWWEGSWRGGWTWHTCLACLVGCPAFSVQVQGVRCHITWGHLSLPAGMFNQVAVEVTAKSYHVSGQLEGEKKHI